MKRKKLKKPPLSRKWYICSCCGKQLAVYDDTASCTGVFVYCKVCKKEVEITIA